MTTWSTVVQNNIKIQDQCILQDGKSMFKFSINEKGFEICHIMLDDYGIILRWKDAKERGL